MPYTTTQLGLSELLDRIPQARTAQDFESLLADLNIAFSHQKGDIDSMTGGQLYGVARLALDRHNAADANTAAASMTFFRQASNLLKAAMRSPIVTSMLSMVRGYESSPCWPILQHLVAEGRTSATQLKRRFADAGRELQSLEMFGAITIERGEDDNYYAPTEFGRMTVWNFQSH